VTTPSCSPRTSANNRARFTELGEPSPDQLYTVAFWERRLAELAEQHLAGRTLYLVVSAVETPSQIAGVVSFSRIAGAPSYACELGASVDGEYEGRGLMHDALRLAIAHVFGAMNLHRIAAEHAVANERSARLLARLGFVREGLYRQCRHVNGLWQDYVAVALLNERWRASR
jgi:ribosomal-protein-alanine N-acetyltransferase